MTTYNCSQNFRLSRKITCPHVIILELIGASIKMDIKNLGLGHLCFWALSKTPITVSQLILH